MLTGVHVSIGKQPTLNGKNTAADPGRASDPRPRAQRPALFCAPRRDPRCSVRPNSDQHRQAEVTTEGKLDVLGQK